LPEALDLATTGPLLCGGITVFAPFVINDIPSTARVGVIGIGGLGHMALQFANKWGCEVHAFTTSDSKEAEAKKLGAHFVHNTKSSEALKKLSRSLDMIISTVNVPIDVPGLLEVLRPKGFLQQVGLIPQPLEVPRFSASLGSEEGQWQSNRQSGRHRRDARFLRATFDRTGNRNIPDVSDQ
jgi:uncharacterized zinc-type alcohol dehydrogenase-like protein